MENSWYDDGGGEDYLTNRDCSSYDPSDFSQPLSVSSSKVFSESLRMNFNILVWSGTYVRKTREYLQDSSLLSTRSEYNNKG